MTTRKTLAKFGFTFGEGGPLSARTLGLADLETVLDGVPADASSQAYAEFIIGENGLNKRSVKARELAVGFLRRHYSLDPAVPTYRVFRWFWERDTLGRPLLALLLACTRDVLLRSSAARILAVPHGSVVEKEPLERYFSEMKEGRYGTKMVQSLARNLRSSWSQTGHLSKDKAKRRTQPNVTVGAVAFALYLGYLKGARGRELFTTEYCRMLDCGEERLQALAADAASKDWLVMKNAGGIIDLNFPQHMTSQEREVLREQD